MMRSINCGIFLATHILFSQACFAANAANETMTNAEFKLNWIGETSAPAYTAIYKEYAVEKSALLQPTRLNLRASHDPQMIEVYNRKKQKWVPLSVNLFQPSSAQVTLSDAFYTNAVRAWQAQDPVTLIIQIDNSTPKAMVYVDGDPIGNIDENGMLKKNVGTKEKGVVVVIAAKLDNCKNAVWQLRAENNPQYFKDPLVVRCKR